jgi:hypothetical protein
MMDEDIIGMGIAFLGDGDGRGVLCWSGKGPQAACCKGQPLGCPTHPVHPSPKVHCYVVVRVGVGEGGGGGGDVGVVSVCVGVFMYVCVGVCV